MHVLFHTGIVALRNPDVPQYSGMASMRPAYIEIITRAFPKLKVQGAQLGNPWYTEAAETAT
jgi:predicted TIM-barrel fold metal-dependent hydrolase